MPEDFTREQLLALGWAVQHMAYEHNYAAFGAVDLQVLRVLIHEKITAIPEPEDEDE